MNIIAVRRFFAFSDPEDSSALQSPHHEKNITPALGDNLGHASPGASLSPETPQGTFSLYSF